VVTDGDDVTRLTVTNGDKALKSRHRSPAVTGLSADEQNRRDMAWTKAEYLATSGRTDTDTPLKGGQVSERPAQPAPASTTDFTPGAAAPATHAQPLPTMQNGPSVPMRFHEFANLFPLLEGDSYWALVEATR
jgi:hypothetical protein